MLRSRLFPSILLSLCIPATSADQALDDGRERGTVVVKVSGLKPAEGGGHYLVAIHDSAERWPDIDEALAVKKVAVTDQTTLEVHFNNIPLGQDYALQALHDENDNGELDMRMFVIPKEGFGLSNAYQPREKPKFDKAAVTFSQPNQLVEIELAY